MLLSQSRSRIKNLHPKKYNGEDKAIRKNQQSSLANQLMKLVQDYQGVQQNFGKNVKVKLERQYRIANPNATTREVDEFVSSGRSQAFANSMMKSEALAAYKDCETRHGQLQKIEQSIEDLFNLMTEMSVLLDVQQEQMDQIEVHTEETVAQLNGASTQMTKAIEHRRGARKVSEYNELSIQH